MTPVPVDGKGFDWPRRVANAINALLTSVVRRNGQDIYTAPTAEPDYDAAQMQALMDAVEALSERLK